MKHTHTNAEETIAWLEQEDREEWQTAIIARRTWLLLKNFPVFLFPRCARYWSDHSDVKTCLLDKSYYDSRRCVRLRFLAFSLTLSFRISRSRSRPHCSLPPGTCTRRTRFSLMENFKIISTFSCNIITVQTVTWIRSVDCNAYFHCSTYFVCQH